MTAYVAFLRGINVGGAARIKMADLKKALAEAGIDDPTTLLQSGNVVFESNAEPSDVVDIVETTIESEFGFAVSVIARTSDEFLDIVAGHPFDDEQVADGRFAHVGFCKGRPSETGFAAIQEAHDGPEELVLGDREIYIYYPDGSGRSKINNTLLEKRLETPVTSRNWNTVLKVADLLV